MPLGIGQIRFLLKIGYFTFSDVPDEGNNNHDDSSLDHPSISSNSTAIDQHSTQQVHPVNPLEVKVQQTGQPTVTPVTLAVKPSEVTLAHHSESTAQQTGQPTVSVTLSDVNGYQNDTSVDQSHISSNSTDDQQSTQQALPVNPPEVAVTHTAKTPKVIVQQTGQPIMPVTLSDVLDSGNNHHDNRSLNINISNMSSNSTDNQQSTQQAYPVSLSETTAAHTASLLKVILQQTGQTKPPVTLADVLGTSVNKSNISTSSTDDQQSIQQPHPINPTEVGVTHTASSPEVTAQNTGQPTTTVTLLDVIDAGIDHHNYKSLDQSNISSNSTNNQQSVQQVAEVTIAYAADPLEVMLQKIGQPMTPVTIADVLGAGNDTSLDQSNISSNLPDYQQSAKQAGPVDPSEVSGAHAANPSEATVRQKSQPMPSCSRDMVTLGSVNKTDIGQRINTTFDLIFAATDNMNSNWHTFDKLMTDFRLVRDLLMCTNIELLAEKFERVKEEMENVSSIFYQIT